MVELTFLYLSNLNKYFFLNEINKCGSVLLLFCRRTRRTKFCCLYVQGVEIALCFVMRKDCINICIDSARINSFIVYVILKAMKFSISLYYNAVCDIIYMLYPSNFIVYLNKQYVAIFLTIFAFSYMEKT